MDKIRTKENTTKNCCTLRGLRQHPNSGTGQVEQLKGELQGFWSRRIDKGSRLVYKIDEDIVTVFVISMKGHIEETNNNRSIFVDE